MPRYRKDTDGPLVTQAEAGRIVGIARQNVPGAIARGELRAVLVGGKPMVTKASAKRAKKRRDAKRSAADPLAA